MDSSPAIVELWSVFELAVEADRALPNPFSEVEFGCFFAFGDERRKILGFHDGGKTWKVRFMPDRLGRYDYRTYSSHAELHAGSGSFDCVRPSPGNHGPVRVRSIYHFAYSDGTPYFMLGTTAYAWTCRPSDVRMATLRTLVDFKFNKLRMLFFPKYLAGLKEIDLTYEPETLPYAGEPGSWDFRNFNVEYFSHFERCVRELGDRGIQADLILFHGYDFGRWGIDGGMNDQDAAFFVSYLVARLAAYRNVWWSLANEYDLVKDRDGGGAISVPDRRDWDALGRQLRDADPYGHPVSIHNWARGPIYPDKEWLSHVSYQNPNTWSLALDLRHRYRKPVVCDEYRYEGNLTYEWGNLSRDETVMSHWLSFMAGAYASHGDCVAEPGNRRDIFWTYGGEMRGSSPPLLRFLRDLAESLPYQEMTPDPGRGDGRSKYCLCKEPDIFLYLLTQDCRDRRLHLGPPDGNARTYEIEVFDVLGGSPIGGRTETTDSRSIDAAAEGFVAILIRLRGQAKKA